MELTVAELFAGVGGFRVGLNNISEFNTKGLAVENGPWNFVWANQWEPLTKVQHAFNCYVTRFGDEGNSNVDINLIDKTTIPDHNLLVGGFPCQDYSVARSLSKEMGIEGKKGVLFWDIKDILIAKKPPFVLLENVDRLLKSPANQRGRDFAVMLKTFDELGYYVHWRVINAADYNMPQKRRRVFIFAFKKHTKYGLEVSDCNDIETLLSKELLLNKKFPIYDGIISENKDLGNYADILDVSTNYKLQKFATTGLMVNGKIYEIEAIPITEEIYTLGEVVEFATKNQGIILDEYIVDENKVDKWKFLKNSKKIERKRPNGEIYYYSEGTMNFPDSLDLPGRTMLTSESTMNRSSHIIRDKLTGKLRTITEVEAELLQMFPPNWTNTGMPKRSRYFMMGNALVTGIISRLEPELRKIILAE